MIKKSMYYLLILAGAIMVFSGDSDTKEDVYLMSAGILVLMFGLYNVSRGISGRQPEEAFIKTEKDETEKEETDEV